MYCYGSLKIGTVTYVYCTAAGIVLIEFIIKLSLAWHGQCDQSNRQKGRDKEVLKQKHNGGVFKSANRVLYLL